MADEQNRAGDRSGDPQRDEAEVAAAGSGNHKPGIKLYTLSTCPWCRKAKKFFSDREIEFEFVDVDLLPEDKQHEVSDEVYKISGSLQYPVAVIHEQVVTGFNPSRYEDILGLPHGEEV
jgi:glutaredoxin